MSKSDHTGEGVGGKTPTPTFPTPDNRGWITLLQFATLLERDYRTVRKWVAEGRVKSIRVGNQIRIMEEEVRYIMEFGTREPTNGKDGRDA